MLSKRLNSNLGNIKTFNTLMGGFATNTIKRPDLFGRWYNTKQNNNVVIKSSKLNIINASKTVFNLLFLSIDKNPCFS